MKDPLKINLLMNDSDRQARRTTVTVAAVFTLVVGLLAAVGSGASYRASTRGTDVFQEVGNFFVFSELRRLVFGEGGSASSDPLKTPDGRLNVLLLGIGGAGHEGAQLTDTIIFASLDKETNRVGLVSVPRDLAYPMGGGRFQKINAVNAYLEQQHPGQGARLTAEAFESQFNTRIDRVVKIDFAGFEKLIDALGGVDVNVERSFTDRSFPTDPNGPNPYEWTSVSFTKGVEHMNGRRALQFVRSRHGSNGESSDFARARRQQIVLSAIRERMLSLGTLSNPKKVSDIWSTLSSHIETDLTAWDVIKLVPLAMNFSTDNITNRVFTDGPDGELYPANNMLFPNKSDWSEIRTAIADPFASKEEQLKQNKPSEAITLEIRNGTLRTGFAGQVATTLERSGYTIASTGNAARRGYERTVIYDLTNGSKPVELARLKKLLDANVSAVPPDGKIVLADGLTNEKVNASSTHFLVILGDSSLSLVNPYAGSSNP